MRPMFCTFCQHRGADATLLNDFEEVIFESAGMCSICMEFVNDEQNKEAVDAIDLKLKSDAESGQKIQD